MRNLRAVAIYVLQEEKTRYYDSTFMTFYIADYILKIVKKLRFPSLHIIL